MRHPVPIIQCNARYFADEGLVNSRVARAKWMLHCTLGCPNTFEYRRQELAALQGPGGGSGPGGGAVSDEAVVESMLESVRPGGLVERYLRLGQYYS